MTEPTPIVPARTKDPAPLRLAPADPGAEIRSMTEAELCALRAGLARALGALELGSRPSELVARLSRQARSELRRRREAPPPQAAA